jgi:hypothetical protein
MTSLMFVFKTLAPHFINSERASAVEELPKITLKFSLVCQALLT